MEHKRTTLKDVAQVSGYALRTVKKVMAGDETVRDSTKQAVLEAAKALHYTPNRAASALARNRDITIAVVYAHLAAAYFPEVERGFRQAQKEFRDFGMILEFFITHEVNYEKQSRILQKILQRDDIDGVIIQPMSARGLDKDIDALTESGKSVVTFGADAPQSSRLCYVGPDAYKSGRIGGQILVNYMGKQGKALIVSLRDEHMQTQERIRGFLDYVSERAPDMEICQPICAENYDKYHDLIRQAIERDHPQGLFCTDANTMITGQLLKQLGRDDIDLVGFDLSQQAIDLMREDYIKVIIEQKPEDISYLATKALFQHIAEKKRPQSVLHTPLYVLTSECLR